MNLFRSSAVVLVLTSGLLALPAQAQSSNASGNPQYTVEAPRAFSMIADLVIARPLLIAATVIGAGVFVITLPFSATGGGIGDAGKALVVDPGKAAFVRCLGCTGDGYNKRE